MGINRKVFFDNVRKTVFGGSILPPAVASLDSLINEYERRNALPSGHPERMTDVRHLAYIMATTRGECGPQMAPVREGTPAGKPTISDAAAQAFVKHQGYRYAKVVNGRVYYGRGKVQMTHDFNYIRMTELGAKAFPDERPDFYNNPELALEERWATWIIFEGMTRSESFKGDFTGKALEDYFSPTKDDPLNARRIVNGTDRAARFAAWHVSFLAGLLRSLT